MSSIVVGMFDSEAAATRARTELVAAGFASSAVSMTGGSGGATTRADADEGGVSGWFKSLFSDEDDAASRSAYTDSYGEAFRRGGYGVSVTASSDAEADRAESVLNHCGAVDIDEKSRGWTGAAVTAAAVDSATAVDAGQPRKLQELEEELKVGKRAVARGGVRIFSRVTEVPVSETVRLREERADVQWTAVDRPATEADFANFKEGSIEIRESAEEAVVGKTARVVGEVSVGKTVTEREETVRDTVRKTTVDVERIEDGDAGAAGTSLSGSSSVGTTGTSGTTGTAGTIGSPNRDPISGEPGAHPVGTAVGATAGGIAAGAAVGTVAGPVGTAIGAAVGAVAGGLAGKGAAEVVDPTTPGTRPGKKTV